MKVTYLFGAGASYKAVPIIGGLNKAFLEISDLINRSIEVKENIELTNSRKIFDALMKTGADQAELFGTVDTYAKKLSLTNNDDLIHFKAALSLFFTIWQDIDKKHLRGINGVYREKETQYRDIDNRYLGLLANYLNLKEDKILLEDNVNFLTWNYDTQLERAISTFTDKSLESVLENHKVYPYYSKSIPKILHLNGIAGIFKESDKNEELKTLFSNAKHSTLGNLFTSVLGFMDKAHSNQTKNDSFYTYAWETDDVSLKALDYADDILKETNILVIIGYSFPTFNDSVDKRLFKTLNSSKNFNMVYYQDPNASVELLNSRFGIKEEKIKIVNEVDQFILPLESHVISKNTPLKRHFIKTGKNAPSPNSY